jgi:hypothetical protein
MSAQPASELLAVLLNACGPQSRQTIPIYRGLPAQKFVNRQLITTACFIKREQTAANRSYNFGLAPHDPTARVGDGKIRYRERTAIGAGDKLGPSGTHIWHLRTLTQNNVGVNLMFTVLK